MIIKQDKCQFSQSSAYRSRNKKYDIRTIICLKECNSEFLVEQNLATSPSGRRSSMKMLAGRRLKPLFEFLQEQIPYHKIRLAMAVLEQKKMQLN